jgi:hypothetical protein
VKSPAPPRPNLTAVSVTYEITVQGRMSPTLLSQFAPLQLVAGESPAETVLNGPVEDQAALFGLLRRIEALGLDLVGLRRLPPADHEL